MNRPEPHLSVVKVSLEERIEVLEKGARETKKSREDTEKELKQLREELEKTNVWAGRFLASAAIIMWVVAILTILRGMGVIP